MNNKKQAQIEKKIENIKNKIRELKLMQTRSFVTPLMGAVLALGLSACSSIDYRHDYTTAIEVIDSNYVESTYDSEVVLNETPWISGVMNAA